MGARIHMRIIDYVIVLGSAKLSNEIRELRLFASIRAAAFPNSRQAARPPRDESRRPKMSLTTSPEIRWRKRSWWPTTTMRSMSSFLASERILSHIAQLAVRPPRREDSSNGGGIWVGLEPIRKGIWEIPDQKRNPVPPPQTMGCAAGVLARLPAAPVGMASCRLSRVFRGIWFLSRRRP